MDEDNPPQHFTPIQSRRFRTPTPCWSLCPSMDLIALGSGSTDTDIPSAEVVAVYRIVSWQRLISLPVEELTSHDDDADDTEWDLIEDGCNIKCDHESLLDDNGGATSITWSPDGRYIAIGLHDGAVLIHSVEASEKEEGETTRPLHIIRTGWFAAQFMESELEATKEVPLKALTFSPRVTRSMAAKRDRLGNDTETLNKELDMVKPQTEQQSTAILGLAWKRVAPHHSTWSPSPSENESRQSWKYTSTLIDRGHKFLPPECYIDTPQTQLFSPLAHLNILFVATQKELHWFLQSRYRILTNSLNFTSLSSISKVHMTSSPDLSTVLCVAENREHFSSEVKVFTCPLLASKRFDLQILSASYRSIFSRLRSVKHGMQSALTSWSSALRPLDTKFQRLFQLFRNYNVVTSDIEGGSVPGSIREELLRFILSGRSTVVGDASNALDQFFTRADMHDQLLIREANGIKASAGSIESKLRSSVQSQIRALVYEIEELYGLIKTHEITSTGLILVKADMALRLYTSSRILYLTFERFIAHVVEARSRLNDFLAWMRGTATEIRARGTAADSIMRQHARDRRCAHGVVCRVTNFLSAPLVSPYRSESDTKLDHRKLTECIIGVPLSDNLAADCTIQASSAQPSLHSALLQTFHLTAALFDQPRNVFFDSLFELEMVFEAPHSLIGLHTRIGAGCDDPSGDGHFSPQVAGDNVHLQNPYWVIVARTIALCFGSNALEIIAIPSDVLNTANETAPENPSFCLQTRLLIDRECEVVSMAFYGDDGNSSLSPNLDIYGESKEGRQELGLIVRNGINEELWKFHYDDVVFDICELRATHQHIRIPSNTNEDKCPILSEIIDDEGKSSIKKRLVCIRDNDLETQSSQLGMCGSRGTCGVLTSGTSNAIEIFDLEEDEDCEECSDAEVDDVD